MLDIIDRLGASLMNKSIGHGTYSIVLGPADSESLTVLFEPGAAEFHLSAGEYLRIVVSGPESEGIELTHGSGYVTLWPSPGLWITAYDSGGSILQLLGY